MLMLLLLLLLCAQQTHAYYEIGSVGSYVSVYYDTLLLDSELMNILASTCTYYTFNMNR